MPASYAAASGSRSAATLAALLAWSATDVAADVVADWNVTLETLAIEKLTDTPHAYAHVYAMTHRAMHNAIAAVRTDRRHGENPVAPETAAAEAAFATLAGLAPSVTRRFDALHRARISHLAADPAANFGQQTGAAVAARLLAGRENDGWPRIAADHDRWTLALAPPPGKIRPDPVWADRKPFVLGKPGQFQAEAPLWSTGGNEILPVKRLQESTILDLPADAPDELRDFWRSAPFLRWNRIAVAIARSTNKGLEDTARSLAVLNSALADALLAGMYWMEEYSTGRGLFLELAGKPEVWVPPLEAAALGLQQASAMRPTIRVQPIVIRNYPLVDAVLAGAAGSVLVWCAGGDTIAIMPDERPATFPPGTGATISLSALARQSAGAALLNTRSTRAAGVSGYELGTRIGRYATGRSGRR